MEEHVQAMVEAMMVLGAVGLIFMCINLILLMPTGVSAKTALTIEQFVERESVRNAGGDDEVLAHHILNGTMDQYRADVKLREDVELLLDEWQPLEGSPTRWSLELLLEGTR